MKDNESVLKDKMQHFIFIQIKTKTNMLNHYIISTLFGVS